MKMDGGRAGGTPSTDMRETALSTRQLASRRSPPHLALSAFWISMGICRRVLEALAKTSASVTLESKPGYQPVAAKLAAHLAPPSNTEAPVWKAPTSCS